MNKNTHIHSCALILARFPWWQGPNLPAACCTVGRGGGKWISVLVYIGAYVCVCVWKHTGRCVDCWQKCVLSTSRGRVSVPLLDVHTHTHTNTVLFWELMGVALKPVCIRMRPLNNWPLIPAGSPDGSLSNFPISLGAIRSDLHGFAPEVECFLALWGPAGVFDHGFKWQLHPLTFPFMPRSHLMPHKSWCVLSASVHVCVCLHVFAWVVYCVCLSGLYRFCLE